ncbi:hypothetical protein SAMN05216390_11537 [Lachnospiraceae bacterium KH1T2]|nr:hypothetical protein SAMN05216390_11537 [Lachnospiraceae bacterium KH1T2]
MSKFFIKTSASKSQADELNKISDKIFEINIGIMRTTKVLSSMSEYAKLVPVIEKISKESDEAAVKTKNLAKALENAACIYETTEKTIINTSSLKSTKKTVSAPVKVNTEAKNSRNRDQGEYKSIEEMLETEYGFDKETSAIIKKIYDKLATFYKNEDQRNLAFFRFMGRIVYHKDSIFDLPKWELLASGPDQYESILLSPKNLGLTDGEYEKFVKAIKDQHIQCQLDNKNEKSKGYGGKTDFAHMCITAAANINDPLTDYAASKYSGHQNGIYDVDKNAGYAGDLFGVNGAKPSMGNDDYKADLDAYNFSKVPKGKNLMEYMKDYYSDIRTGNKNRAEEFLKNLGDGDIEKGKAVIEKDIHDNCTFRQNLDKKNDEEYNRILEIVKGKTLSPYETDIVCMEYEHHWKNYKPCYNKNLKSYEYPLIQKFRKSLYEGKNNLED